MNILSLIESKKKGFSLTKDELTYFINSFNAGDIPDYQASALLMAIVLRGMNSEETAFLTMAMVGTGRIVDLSGIDGFIADKHSTGGVGDKTSLIVLPVVSSCGVKVAKLSGRGLGFTGGTIDKLESIPGFRTSLDTHEFKNIVNRIGIAIASQTEDLVPADKKLYSLRDVTGTIDSIPLIASSIMSKKLASGAAGIVLDVKTGSGAFMKTLDEAYLLANEMLAIGKSAGRKVTALITRMDRPLGATVGNSLEVNEAIETLKGNGPGDLNELCIEISACILELAGLGDHNYCCALAVESIKNGTALQKFRDMIEAQGGDTLYIDDHNKYYKARYKTFLPANSPGYISSMDTDAIGRVSAILGAGRSKKSDTIDMTAGIIFSKKTGDIVSRGEIIAELHTSDNEKFNEALAVLSGAIHISDNKPVDIPVIHGIYCN